MNPWCIRDPIPLASVLDARRAVKRWTEPTDDARKVIGAMLEDKSNTEVVRELVAAGVDGSVWWVSSEMSRLVDVAAKTMPDVVLTSAIVPDPDGVVFFASPLTGTTLDGEPDDGLLVSAMSWSTFLDASSRQPGVVIATWSRVRVHEQGPVVWGPCGLAYWTLRDACMDDNPSQTEDRRRLAALWLLSAQEGVSAISSERPDRAAARRAARRSEVVPDAMKVVRLRRPARSDNEGGSSDPNWSHRWVVSGHWRNQWFPSLGTHLPKWIAPYVKGPDGAPLVVKETVKALVR